jgi:hypothetical protein
MKLIGSLVCFLFVFATVTAQSNIKLDVFSGSNAYWLVVAVRNAGVDTASVQMKESNSHTWEALNLVSGWGYWTSGSSRALYFPISIRLTSVDGRQLTLPNIIPSASAGMVDTGVQYVSGPTPGSGTSTPRPTYAPATPEPTSAPTTGRHTSAPTTAKSTSAPATKAPTSAPATKAPTSAPATKAPTSAPATQAPTIAATAKPTTSGGCSGGMKLMVPLYTYPGATWDTVIASASVVPTVAIINPNSGPGSGPDSSFRTYMTKMRNAGVEMVGYVHTSYGARSISEVKAEIDIYASQFPLVVGIFLDEVSAASGQLSYYQQLYSYIMGMPGWKYDILNPGTVPVAGYANAATQIVTYESAASGFASSSNPSWASCNNKNQFAMITYGATSSSSMQSAISAAKSKGVYGWVYVTNTGATGATYNSLPSYYASMASYIASLN